MAKQKFNPVTGKLDFSPTNVTQKRVFVTIETGVLTIPLNKVNHFHLEVDQSFILEFGELPIESDYGTYCIHATQTGSFTMDLGSNVVYSLNTQDISTNPGDKFKMWLTWDGEELWVNVVNKKI